MKASEDKRQHTMNRRDFVKAAAAALSFPTAAFVSGNAEAAKNLYTLAPGANTGGSAKQLTLAISAPPPALDYEFFFGPDVWTYIFNINDRLTRWSWRPVPAVGPGAQTVNWQAENVARITVPRMATSWTVSPDGTVYTFHLRRGWKSHWGNEFTAADVRWTIERSFALKAIGSFFDLIQNLKGPESVKVLDPYTVQFNLTSPTPDLLLEMSTFWRGIYDSTEAKRHATQADPWAKEWLHSHDAGFGPYRVESLTTSEVVLVAAEGHPFPPKIQRLVFKVIPESASRVELLSRGEIDVAQNLSPEDLVALSKTSGVHVWAFQGYNILQSPLNGAYPPLDKTLVRQALSYAVPYNAIVKDVYKGFAMPAYGPLVSADAGYTPSIFPYSYNPTKAKQLLAQAGLARGFSTYYTYPISEPEAEQVGTVLRTAFAEIGVTLDLRGVPAAEFNQVAFSAKTPLGYYNFGADSPDPHYVLSVFYLGSSSNNWGNYRNPKFDAMVEAAGKKLDWSSRLAAHRVAEKFLIDDAAWLWIAQTGYQLAARSNVVGINWYPGQSPDWSIVDKT
jgi:peptide/nickel transport system substrate-binding protein